MKSTAPAGSRAVYEDTRGGSSLGGGVAFPGRRCGAARGRCRPGRAAATRPALPAALAQGPAAGESV